jgi:UDP-glucose 4-epimerase
MVDEFLCFAYQREYGLEAIPMRFFNTVGARQSGQYGMVIPRFVQQALRGEAITVYGDGTQTRCFCDVRDVVRAVVGLAEHPEAAGSVYNIGSTEEVSINELAERVKALSNNSPSIVRIPYDEAYAPGFEDMQRRLPDITRISNLLTWRPPRTLDDILLSVIEYEKTRL